MCVELGELYKYSVCESGNCIELRLYENRSGKEKDFEWGVAGEIIAKRVGKINGVECACYSPSLQHLCVKIPKNVEGLEAIVRAVLDIVSEVMVQCMTATGKAKLVLDEFGIEPVS